MKKRNARNGVATSAATTTTTTANEIAEPKANEIETPATSEVTTEPATASDEVTSEQLREQAAKLRDEAKAKSPDLEKLDVGKLDAAKLKEMSKQIAECEKLERQAEKLEKQANALGKSKAKALLEAAKANETKEAEKHLETCEEIAKAEREFLTLQNANDKMHQASIWAFNALTDTDFLLDRDAHANTIQTFESISKQIDAQNILTSELAKQAQDKMRALYIANPEALASSQMTKARKAIGVKASKQMQAIVDGENADEATSESKSDESEAKAKAA